MDSLLESVKEGGSMQISNMGYLRCPLLALEQLVHKNSQQWEMEKPLLASAAAHGGQKCCDLFADNWYSHAIIIQFLWLANSMYSMAIRQFP